jgi:hypothetical protein
MESLIPYINAKKWTKMGQDYVEIAEAQSDHRNLPSASKRLISHDWSIPFVLLKSVPAGNSSNDDCILE